MEEEFKKKRTFVKLSNEDGAVEDLIRLNKNAFILLTFIALRVRRSDSPINGLKKGSCYLGDFSSYNLTEQEYRSAKKTLIKCGIIEATATPRGTTVKLVSDSIFMFNFIDRNTQLTPKSTPQLTPKQRTGNGQPTGSQRTANGQVTTNLDGKIVDEVDGKMVEATPCARAQELPYSEECRKVMEILSIPEVYASGIMDTLASRSDVDPVLVANKVFAKYRNIAPGEKAYMWIRYFNTEKAPPRPEPKPTVYRELTPDQYAANQ